MIYTSGTTSTPKGVPIKHSSCDFSTRNITKTLQYSKNDVDLLPLQLSHSFGLGCLHTSLFVGSTLVLQKNPKTVDILNSIKKYNVTTLAAIPSTLSNISGTITGLSVDTKMFGNGDMFLAEFVIVARD